MADTLEQGGGQAPDVSDEGGSVPESAAPGTPAPGGATGTASVASAPEPSFFDPSAVPEDLKPAYKSMQAAFTRKTQELAKQREKVQAYDAFMSDPVGQMQRLAGQYGLSLTRAEAKAAVEQQSAQQWVPQTWDEVLERAESRAEERVLQKLSPLLGEVRNLKKTQIETMLDSTVPEWRQYEDQMSQVLRDHPSLVNAPELLARAVIPQEVQEGRAMAAALKKLEGKAQAARVSHGSQTSKEQSEAPTGSMTFDQAVAFARRQLEKKGMKAP